MAAIVEMLGITKIFGELVANDNIDFKLDKGEIHAIVGENGAGKSTLMSILFGLISPNKGTIKINNKTVTIDNPNTANRLGIGMVHQHFKLVEDFTVLQNIVLGKESKTKAFIDYETPRKEILNLSNKYKLKVDLEAKISEISVGMQQRVEILKMLYRKADIMIFDEPTAVLTPQEIEELVKILKNFAKEGKSIILITHKLEEVKAMADKCTVLRRGKSMGTHNVKTTSVEKMAELMVGRKIVFTVKKSIAKPGKEVFRVEGLTVKKDASKNYVSNVSFNVRAGEIVTLAGIEGNGQTQLIRAISGLSKFEAGKIYFNGKDITHDNIRSRFEAGISHIPEDRQKEGLVLDYNLKNNFILCDYYKDKFQNKFFLKAKNIDAFAEEMIAKFDVRTSAGKDTIAREMSGGNQQKAILAREFSRPNKMIIAVQPTRGLDVGAIEYIHKKLIEARDAGLAILIVSLELEEVLNISDRILIMFDGKIVKETAPMKISVNEMGMYMAGSKREGKNVNQ
jgi:ABC-type uncharacterized transport system ATPase subunit